MKHQPTQLGLAFRERRPNRARGPSAAAAALELRPSIVMSMPVGTTRIRLRPHHGSSRSLASRRLLVPRHALPATRGPTGSTAKRP